MAENNSKARNIMSRGGFLDAKIGDLVKITKTAELGVVVGVNSSSSTLLSRHVAFRRDNERIETRKYAFYGSGIKLGRDGDMFTQKDTNYAKYDTMLMGCGL